MVADNGRRVQLHTQGSRLGSHRKALQIYHDMLTEGYQGDIIHVKDNYTLMFWDLFGHLGNMCF